MGSEFQQAPLRMIFDVKKEDSRCKARIMAGGHLIYSSHAESCSSTLQSMSIRMSLTMAESCNLNAMGGHTGSAFPYALDL